VAGVIRSIEKYCDQRLFQIPKYVKVFFFLNFVSLLCFFENSSSIITVQI
jgi:hypothetical protein